MANFGEYPAPSSDSIQVCCITMNMMDRLRLLACPPEIIPMIREDIQSVWGTVQDERPYHGSHEFKLKGSPWSGRGEGAVSSRALLVAILTTMAKQGWNLIQSSDTSKKEGDKDSLFFEKKEKGEKEPVLFAVSFNESDKVRLIGAPNHDQLVLSMKNAVEKFWPKGIQKQKWLEGGNYEMKLSGSPWWPTGGDSVHSKLMLCQLLANFRSVGYKLYASVDLSMVGSEGHDLETWVFRQVGSQWS